MQIVPAEVVDDVHVDGLVVLHVVVVLVAQVVVVVVVVGGLN